MAQRPLKTEIIKRLEQSYIIENDLLTGEDGLTLKAYKRNKPRRGQPKRYLAYYLKDNEEEIFEHLSGLWAEQGTANIYKFDVNGEHYRLALTGIGSAVIKAVKEEPALVFKEGR